MKWSHAQKRESTDDVASVDMQQQGDDFSRGHADGADDRQPAKPGYRGTDVENYASQMAFAGRREFNFRVARWAYIEIHGFPLILQSAIIDEGRPIASGAW
jgi:hypothetical protein